MWEMIQCWEEKLEEHDGKNVEMTVDTASEEEAEQADGEPGTSSEEWKATGTSRPGRLDPLSTELVSLVIHATDFKGKLDVRFDGVRFGSIGRKGVNNMMTDLIDKTRGVVDSGSP